MCKKIVESQGGKIWLDTRKRKGATLYFTLEHTPEIKIKTEEKVQNKIYSKLRVLSSKVIG